MESPIKTVESLPKPVLIGGGVIVVGGAILYVRHKHSMQDQAASGSTATGNGTPATDPGSQPASGTDITDATGYTVPDPTGPALFGGFGTGSVGDPAESFVGVDPGQGFGAGQPPQGSTVSSGDATDAGDSAMDALESTELASLAGVTAGRAAATTTRSKGKGKRKHDTHSPGHGHPGHGQHRNNHGHPGHPTGRGGQHHVAPTGGGMPTRHHPSAVHRAPVPTSPHHTPTQHPHPAPAHSTAHANSVFGPAPGHPNAFTHPAPPAPAPPRRRYRR